MKEKNKKFIQVFALAVIMFLIASASYAYFAAQYGEASSTDIIVNTSTVDNLTFETGDAISISATQSNFTEGSGNQSGSTYASATLLANNDTNEASANYYLYIKIDTNEFEYTTSDKTAELILSITDPDGNEVISLSGLTYISVTDGDGNTISRFDITSKIGLITIADNYLIESVGSNTQEWDIEVTLVNLDSDQSDNAGKSFSASLLIQSSVYGNTLQAVGSSSYSDKFWAYKSNITKIVFDDSGTIIDDYEEVYDITDDGSYCYYDGNEVYNYDNWSTYGVTESSCNTVYKVTDDDYTRYIDDSYTVYLTDMGEAVWDSDSNLCKTSDGNEVVSWQYLNSLTEDQCNGTVYYDSSWNYYLSGIEYVGSGEWADANNYSSIQAYLVNNRDDTYTVYIESDAPILGNEDMSYWFSDFISLESIEGLDKLVTSYVIDMSYMFYYSFNLTSLDLSNFNTSMVTDMSYMFSNCYDLSSLDLSAFDTSSVNNMNAMFGGCSSLISLDLSSFDTSNVINMSYMFGNMYSVSGLTFIVFGENFDTSNVTNMEGMFSYCSNLTSLDVSEFNTSKVTTMQNMFSRCSSLISLDLSSFDTSKVNNMYSMFSGCSSLTSLDFSNFDTSKVLYMNYMFSECSKLISLDLSYFDTSNVTSMNSMFYNCSSLSSLDLSSFDTSKVTSMYAMFYNCSSLISLDMSIASFTKLTSSSRYNYMFYNNNPSITVTVKDSTAQTFITARLSEYNGGTVVIA